MNKTDRKNKINLTVNWPTNGSYFTVKELWEQYNPNFIEITLRVRVDKAIKKDKTVAIIGYKNVGKGRPTMILAMNPVTQDLLDKAYADGIQPPEIKPLVTVMDVTAPISTSDVIPTPTVDIPATPVNIAATLGTTISA